MERKEMIDETERNDKTKKGDGRNKKMDKRAKDG